MPNEAVFPSFEGWGATKDGTGYFIVLGYKNRNRTQTSRCRSVRTTGSNRAVPITGSPRCSSRGARRRCLRSRCPKDFGSQEADLDAGRQRSARRRHLLPESRIQHRLLQGGGERERAAANEVRVRTSPMMSGPSAGFAQTLTGTVGQPVPLKLWASDAPPTEKNWETIVIGAEPADAAASAQGPGGDRERPGDWRWRRPAAGGSRSASGRHHGRVEEDARSRQGHRDAAARAAGHQRQPRHRASRRRPPRRSRRRASTCCGPSRSRPTTASTACAASASRT